MKRPRKVSAFSRRRFATLSSSFVTLMLLGAGAAVAYPALSASEPEMTFKRPKTLGTTFSQLQCRYLGLDYRETFRHICALGFDRIRLCSYWDEIEVVEHQFDFSTLDWLLEEAERWGIEVVLAVGMKVPRWPEFHFPAWLTERYDTRSSRHAIDENRAIADRAIQFVEQVVQHTRNASNLTHWQIENEPFTRLDITAGRFLSPEFVREEVKLVRSLALPSQKLLLTTAISLPAAQAEEDDRAFRESLTLADAVGVNVYTKVPAGNSEVYLQPFPAYWRKLKRWQETLMSHDRESWVAEAQAEPWEPNQLVAMKRMEYPSSSPSQALRLIRDLVDLGYDTIMMWGCEYWYWQKKNSYDAWWQTVEQLISA